MNLLPLCAAIGTLLGIIALFQWLLLRAERKRLHAARVESRGNQVAYEIVQEELNQLQEQEATKDKFFVSVSHELRSPLNSIMGFSELLLTTETDPEQDEFIQNIQGSGNDLLHVMNNLMDYAHIHARTLVCDDSHFDFAQFLHDICLEVEISAKRKGLRFHAEKDCQKSILLKTDKTYLYTLLYNLLINAVKFTDRGDVVFRVNCEVESTDLEEGLIFRVRFEVEDTGIGIPPDELTKIYSPFYKVERKSEGTRGGLGLGLAVVSKLVDLLHGTVKYTPVAGGSRFTVEMSLPGIGGDNMIRDRGRKLRLSGQKTSIGESFYKHHILIAEDIPSNVRLLQVMLRKMGHTYDVATNGQEAVYAAQNKTYDVILMDIQMPLLSGTAAAKMIREGKAGNRNIITPIIALTALSSELDSKILNDSGINQVVTKPVNVNQLRSVLTSVAREKPAGVQQQEESPRLSMASR